MDFALSDEQDALAEAERAWLTRNDPLVARRRTLDDGPARLTPADRRHLGDSGLVGLLTEDMGGTHVDLAVLVEEHGRAGSPTPLADIVVAARLLALLDHPALLSSESGVELVLPVLASVEDSVLASVEDSGLHAETNGGDVRLVGSTAPVPGLLDADHVLVLAQTATGTEIAAVLPLGAVAVRTLDTLDLTRSWSVVDLDVTLTEGQWLPLPTGTVAYVHDELSTYRALDALGAAARLLDLTVEYTKQRVQFDRPIAGFQAIKHHCANMAVSVESSRAALWAAVVALDTNPDNRTSAVSAGAAHAGEGASTTAQTALQVHGGIGFTWEHDLHLLLRRIKVDELLDGSVSFHRRRLVTA